MSISTKAKFITFEGIDGCGKSTQAKLLLDRLVKNGYQGIMVREPGGTSISEEIREILLQKNNRSMVSRTEALLMTASRSQLTQEVIIPNLEKNQWVIADRYADSTLAYQGGGRDINLEWLTKLNTFATFDLKPDCTFYIDILPMEALRRRCDTTDRIEEEGDLFQKNVRQTYLELAKQYSDRIIILDGYKSEDEIHNSLWNELKRRSFLT